MESGTDKWTEGTARVQKRHHTEMTWFMSPGTTDQQGKAEPFNKQYCQTDLSTWGKNGPLPDTIYKIISSRIKVSSMKSKSVKLLEVNIRLQGWKRFLKKHTKHSDKRKRVQFHNTKIKKQNKTKNFYSSKDTKKKEPIHKLEDDIYSTFQT